MLEKQKLLYVYEKRIPQNLRELVLSFLPKDEFEIDKMTYDLSDEEKIKKLKRAEIVLFAPGRFLSENVLKEASHIKLMQLWSSGYDKFNTNGAAKYGIPVANNGGANAESVAEHAIMLMLAFAKRLPDSHLRTTTGNWQGNSHGMDMFMLKNKTLGIVGFGNIGKAVAKKLSGFEMRILYYDIKKQSLEIEKEHGANFSDLNNLLSQSDIITLHLHLNQSTEKIIGERELSLMKKNTVLINVSRAQLIDQEAIYNVLKNKKIQGAGLDVYPEEPTKPNDPLLTLPNVVATPHMAGSTYDAYVTAMTNAVENFRRIKRGEKPIWIVN